MKKYNLILASLIFSIFFQQSLVCMEEEDASSSSGYETDDSRGSEIEAVDYWEYRNRCLKILEVYFSKHEGEIIPVSDLMELWYHTTQIFWKHEPGMKNITEEDVRDVYEEGVERIKELVDYQLSDLFFDFITEDVVNVGNAVLKFLFISIIAAGRAVGGD